MSHLFLLTMLGVNSWELARDGFPMFVMEIVSIFHSDWILIDCRDTFINALHL